VRSIGGAPAIAKDENLPIFLQCLSQQLDQLGHGAHRNGIQRRFLRVPILRNPVFHDSGIILQRGRTASLLVQLPSTARLNTSPGSHSAWIWKGRQQTSQSVVKDCSAMEVSMAISMAAPQKGHWTVSNLSICQIDP
jgi:hypothetical protein